MYINNIMSNNNSMLHIKCVLLGEANIGKTSLIIRYLYNKFHQFSESTIGCAFNNKVYKKNDTSYKIDIWDTAGQEKYRGLMPMYYRNADIVFICLDLSEKKTSQIVENFNYWNKQINYHSDNKDRLIALVGTKSDNKNDNITEEKIKELAKNYNFNYYQTSALSNLGIQNMFNDMVNSAINILENKINEQSGSSYTDLSNINQETNTNYNCCY